MLVEISNLTRSRIAVTELTVLTEKFLLSRRLSRAEVSLVIVGDQRMRRLNREYRGKDKVTDVLSFREQDSSVVDKNYLGEIIINWPQIKRQAPRHGQSARAELRFILVHGLLHLVGYNDKMPKEAERMIKLGEQFLAKHCHD
jgi:probable rRNA maturation factor